MKEVRDIKDVRREKGIATELTKLEDLVGETIIIQTFEEQEGRYGSSIAIYAIHKGEPVKILTTGKVLRSDLAQIEGNFPVKAKVELVKGAKHSYYVLE